jgi:hypothetical protein
MRILAPLFVTASLTVLLTACGESTAPTAPNAPATTAPSFNPNISLQVTAWGPQEAKVGAELPNKQPDGNVGIWIKVNSTEGLGDAQVLFGGQPAEKIALAPDLVTAAVPAAWFASAGDKEIVIKQVGSQKTFAVGSFKIQP